MKPLALRTNIDRLKWVQSHLLRRRTLRLVCHVHLLELLCHALEARLLTLGWIRCLWRLISALWSAVLRLSIRRLGRLTLHVRVAILCLLGHSIGRLLWR